jgi:hypothetical protein
MNQGPRCVVLMKKNGGEKSHATVPLILFCLNTSNYVMFESLLIAMFSKLKAVRRKNSKAKAFIHMSKHKLVEG